MVPIKKIVSSFCHRAQHFLIKLTRVSFVYQCFDAEDGDGEAEAADDDLELLSLRRPIARSYGPVEEKNESQFCILTTPTNVA